MMDVNLSEPREVGDQLDKHHVIPQITLSTDMMSLSLFLKHTHSTLLYPVKPLTLLHTVVCF